MEFKDNRKISNNHNNKALYFPPKINNKVSNKILYSSQLQQHHQLYFQAILKIPKIKALFFNLKITSQQTKSEVPFLGSKVILMLFHKINNFL